MRLSRVIAITLIAAGCGGHTSSPSSATPQAAAARPPLEPSTLRFATGTTRYRYEQVQHSQQEMMGQTQTRDATTLVLLSVVVTPAAGGNLDAAYTIDSVAVTGSGDAAGPLSTLRGKTWHAVYTMTGAPVSFTPPDTDAVSLLGGEMFRDFMPSLPTGSVAAGTTWVDTVVGAPQRASGATIRTRSVRSSRSVGWEPRDSTRALHISTSGTYTIEGEGEQGGANYTIAGQGTASAERYVSSAGMYLGSTGSDSANIVVDVPSAGIQIPIVQTRRTTLTRLP